MPTRERVFTSRKRRVYRKIISKGEVFFGAFFIGFLLLAGSWFISRGEAFDPGERDVSLEALEEGVVEDNLYRSPLVPWAEPGATAGSAPQIRLGVFPDAILAGGWQPSSRLQEFDESNLFEKINGAAPQYFQFGFQSLSFLALKDETGEAEINIEFYDMGRLPYAMGIFAAQRDASRKLETIDRAHFYTTSVGALGIIDQYYFKITGNSDSPVIQKKAIQLIESFCEMEPNSAALPKLYTVLVDRLQIPFERVEYQKSDAFQFAFAQDFWFAKPAASSDLRLFAHEAESAEEATGLYEQLVENNLYDFTLIDQSGEEVSMKHNFLGSFMVLKRSGNLVYGVEEASDQEELNRYMQRIGEALFNDEEM